MPFLGVFAANYRAVRCLSLVTLNCERSSILLVHYMNTGEVLSPKQASAMEHVLPPWMSLWTGNKVKYLHQRVCLGVRISSLYSDEVVELSSLAGSYYNKGKYILLARKNEVSVIMHKDSTAADVLQAFMHGLVFAKVDDKDRSPHLDSQSWTAKNYESFILKLQALGWRTERLVVPSVAWKANWSINSSDEKVD